MPNKILPALLVLALLFSTFLTLNPTSTDAITNSPAKLKIYTGPTSVLADNNTYACINIQLLDQNGNPTRATQDTVITLSSSEINVGTVQPTVTILENDTYAQAEFTATYLPGITTIYASANGYATVQATMTTVGPIPYSVAVYGFPPTLPADGSTYEAIMVQLQDSKGVPAVAPRGGVYVTLISSNTTVGTVTPNVMIEEGETYATANFTTSLNHGSATITSVGQGYESKQVTITTTPIEENTADILTIFVGPSKIPADNSVHTQISIQIQKDLPSLNHVATLPYDLTVQLGSSDPTIGVVESQIIIPKGETFNVTSLHTTFRPGTTTITAVASDLERCQKEITTTGFIPSKLAVYLNPSDLPADNSNYQNLQVQLQDGTGQPARAFQSDVNLKLFSSVPVVAEVCSDLIIPLGETQASEPGTIYVSNAPGTTDITAQASGYTTGVGTLNTYIVDLSPLQVTVTASPATVENEQKTNVTVHVAANNIAISGATVGLSCDKGGSFTTTVDVGGGDYRSTFTAPRFTQTTTCTISVTAEKDGYFSSYATTQVSVQLPPGPSPSPSPSPSASPDQASQSTSNSTSTTTQTTDATTINLQLQIQDADGKPLVGTEVSSTSQPAGVRHLYAFTNESGYVTFHNVLEGKYTFSLEKEGYGKMNKTITFAGQPLSVEMTLGGADAGSDSTLTIVVSVVLVIIAVVLVLLLIRRRRRSRENIAELPPLSSFKY